MSVLCCGHQKPVAAAVAVAVAVAVVVGAVVVAAIAVVAVAVVVVVAVLLWWPKPVGNLYSLQTHEQLLLLKQRCRCSPISKKENNGEWQ